jgi:hypothetical protein
MEQGRGKEDLIAPAIMLAISLGVGLDDGFFVKLSTHRLHPRERLGWHSELLISLSVNSQKMFIGVLGEWL